jgi:hypothetical protein
MLNFLAGPFGAICKLVPLYSLLRSLFLTAGDIHEVVLIIEVVLRKDNYNSMQRSIDILSFVLSLRVRVLFDNAKWAYPGGFSEEKQVCV